MKCNLRGQDGHGISRITVYSKRLRAGIVNPRPQIKIENISTSAALCEGDNGMGFVVATEAMDRAIDLAKGSGIGIVGVKYSTHFGSSAQYVQQALDDDMISMVFTNSSPALPPWGGFKPFLGASPIAAGVPAGKEQPFLMDMSTTVIARGKLRLAAQRGEPIQFGIGLDKHGNPTTDGMEAFHGVTLPFGGGSIGNADIHHFFYCIHITFDSASADVVCSMFLHFALGYKGAAISLWMEILSGVLTGAAFGGRVSSLYNDFTTKENVGHLLIAIKPDLFMPMEVFKDRMDDLVRRVKSQPLAQGFEEILMVGEPEIRQEQKRLLQGIPLQIDVAKSLQAEGESLGVPFPFDIPV